MRVRVQAACSRCCRRRFGKMANRGSEIHWLQQRRFRAALPVSRRDRVSTVRSYPGLLLANASASM